MAVVNVRNFSDTPTMPRMLTVAGVLRKTDRVKYKLPHKESAVQVKRLI